jgi:hypothetical protein
VNFDEIVLAGGNLSLGATAKLRLSFMNSASAPNAADPFWRMSHTWKIVSLTGTATNIGNTAFGVIVNGGYATGNFTNYSEKWAISSFRTSQHPSRRRSCNPSHCTTAAILASLSQRSPIVRVCFNTPPT